MPLAHRCPKCRSTRTERVRSPLNRLDLLRLLVLVLRYRCQRCNWPFTDFALNLRLVKPREQSRASSTSGSDL